MTTTGIATIIAIVAIVCLVIYLGNILYKKNIPSEDKSKKVCCGTSCTSKSTEVAEEGCVGPVREYTKPNRPKEQVVEKTCDSDAKSCKKAKTEKEARKGIGSKSCKQPSKKTAEKKPATKKKPVAKSKAKSTTNATKTKAVKKKTTSTAKTPKTKK